MRRAVGIDLGGSKIAAGVVDEAGRILSRREVPTQVDTPDDLARSVSSLVKALDPDSAEGLGIGAAGVVDFERGRYLFGPNTGLGSMDIVGVVGAASGLDVRVDNDANCAAWAEHRFGAGRGTRHFLCVTLGTGIGGGIVIDGRPYRGARGGAAEFGHMLVDPGGPPCGCGRRGCWEQMASGQALQTLGRNGPSARLTELAGGDPDTLTGPMVTQAAREGDPRSLEIVEHVARWVGIGLASLVNIFEPETIAIGGGLVVDWDLFGPTAGSVLRDEMEAPEHRPVPRLAPAELGPDAGVVGAACLMFEDG